MNAGIRIISGIEERNTKSPSCLDLELTTELCVFPLAVAIQIFKKGAGIIGSFSNDSS